MELTKQDGQDGLKELGKRSWSQWAFSHFPPGQFGRYLVVGLFNTAFGYGTYAGLTALLTPHVTGSYVIACVFSSLLNITFSFFNYKWFIFKTKGNYLREWVRCVVVYSGTIVMGVAIVSVLVFVIRHLTTAQRSAPYLAGAIQVIILASIGFLGHRNFSFRRGSNGNGESEMGARTTD